MTDYEQAIRDELPASTYLLDRLGWAHDAARMALGEQRARPGKNLRPVEKQKLDALMAIYEEMKNGKAA